MTVQQDPYQTAHCTLDHDGCITCSDAGIPVEVISIRNNDALCQDTAGNQAEIAIDLVAPVKTGETLLAHGGVAIAKIQAKSGRSGPKANS